MAVRYQPPKKGKVGGRLPQGNYGYGSGLPQGNYGTEFLNPGTGGQGNTGTGRRPGIGISNNPLQNLGSSTTVPTNQDLQPNAMTNTAANSRMLDRSQFGISPQEQQANQLQGSGVPQPRQITGFQPAQGFTGNIQRQPPPLPQFQVQQQQPTIGGVSQAPQPQQFQVAQQQPTVGGVAPAVPPQPQQPALPPVGGQGAPQPAGYQNTDVGRQAQDQYAQYAMGQDPMVASAQQRMQRENLNRVAQARRLAHERAVQSGFRPGSAQYEQMMRQGVSDANNASIEALNQFGDFARGRRSDQQRELATVSETEFGRSRDARGEAWSDFNQVVKFLPSDKAQQMFLAGKLGGQDITQSFRNMYQADGTIKPEFRDLTKVELIKKGIGDAVGGMTTNPDTKAAFASDADRKAYADKFYDENFQNILFPAQTQAGQREEQQATQSSIDAFLAGGDISAMGESDWKAMTGPQIDKAVSSGQMQKFEGTQTFWRTSDFVNSGLKADKVEEVVDDGNPSSDASSAGQGNGSVIVYNGQPMRITRYSTKKDTTGTNERIGRVYAIPLKGGKEVEISSTGWKDL